MHNQIIGSSGMDQESRIAQANNTYGHDPWVDMSTAYHHQTTMPDYGTGFSYMPPITHGLPSESLHRMPPPPPPQHMSQTQTTHPQLPMLIMPSHATWPSMLTNPNSYASHSAPPVAIPPVTAPLKQAKLPAIHAPSQPRKTLTDDDRRRMCQYAEDHPNTKQTEIGAMFGVERSTVSKVLRNKEKYLFPEDRSSSPIKRTKAKGVDVEKALTNYIRNAQKSGAVVSDSDIKEKVRLFSATMGNSADGLLKANSSSWLEKFKQKNGIGKGRLMRRASETNIPDSIQGSSPSLTPSQPSSAISPASPSGHRSQSPLSANRSEDDKEGMSSFMDFTTDHGAYKHSNSQSTATSLSSAFTDATASSFPGSALSPTTPFNFSPDPNMGDFLASKQLGPGDASSNFHRPRSQTFPTLDLECMNQPQTTEPLTPRYHHVSSATAPSSAIDSPAGHEIPAPHFGSLDHHHHHHHHQHHHSMASPQLRHSSSNGSMAAAAARSKATTPISATSPSSPTQEDARRAADTLLSFIQNAAASGAGGAGFVDQSEYMAVVRLTEKLRLHHQSSSSSQIAAGGKAAAAGEEMPTTTTTTTTMGGLSRIPEGDSEMPNASPGMMPKMEPTPLGA